MKWKNVQQVDKVHAFVIGSIHLHFNSYHVEPHAVTPTFHTGEVVFMILVCKQPFQCRPKSLILDSSDQSTFFHFCWFLALFRKQVYSCYYSKRFVQTEQWISATPPELSWSSWQLLSDRCSSQWLSVWWTMMFYDMLFLFQKLAYCFRTLSIIKWHINLIKLKNTTSQSLPLA